MHEYSIVEQYVEGILEQLKRENIQKVDEVVFRRGSTFSEGALVQAFQMLTQDTPLQEAQLQIEEYQEELECENCGHKQVVTADDLVGHIYICSNCGYSKQIDEGSGLELVKVTV